MKKILYHLQKLAVIGPTALFSVGSFSVCPFCLPFYAGVMGILGVQKGTAAFYLFLVLALAMLISLGYALHLAIKSKQFLLGGAVLCGFFVTIFSKFYDMKILLYLGLLIFVISIFRIKKSCKNCKVSEHKETKN